MRIAFFIGHMGAGGAERVISILANDYADKGWDVDIIMLLANRVEHKLRPQIRTISLVGTSERYTKNAMSWLVRIRSYVKNEKPDRVVSFIGRINALVLTATIGMKVPVIVSERNDPKHDGRGKVMLWYCNTIYHRAKAIVFQNKYEQSCFDDSLKHKGVVVPNPVEVSAVKTYMGQEFIITTAGRLHPQKNHHMLIDAMEIVHSTHASVKCRIYGDGILREELRSYIDQKNLADCVTLEGNHTDIHEKLAECSLFILTSEYEGLSNALIEAMMIGLPCVTTDYGGADELIHDGENGFIVKRNKCDDLADILLRLIEDSSLQKRISASAREYAKQFSAEVVLKQWESVIALQRK